MRLRRMVCELVGHKPVDGKLIRSPWTSYTHLREVNCTRCGDYLDWRPEYHDARTEPELFRAA